MFAAIDRHRGVVAVCGSRPMTTDMRTSVGHHPVGIRDGTSHLPGRRGSAYCRIGLAYVCREDPPGLSPITTVGRFATVDEAQLATDKVWASR